MQFNRLDTVHLGTAVHAGDQVIERTHGDKTNPAQRARMDMAHGPVGVMTQGVDRLDRHHRTLESRHAIERQRDNQKPQDRIGAQLVPGARERHDAVYHAAPAGCQQNKRKHHADGLRPIWQRRVMQMVRPRPHVGEDQRPEVNDGQAVGVHRAACLLGDVVVHHPEKTCGEQKANGVMAVPPLHHGILHASVG